MPHAQELLNRTVELTKGRYTTALQLRLARMVAPNHARNEAVVIEQIGACPYRATSDHCQCESHGPDQCKGGHHIAASTGYTGTR